MDSEVLVIITFKHSRTSSLTKETITLKDKDYDETMGLIKSFIVACMDQMPEQHNITVQKIEIFYD